MSEEERYAEHTVAWELPNGDSVTKSNYNLASIETKYIPIQTKVISDDKDKRIADLEAKLAESKHETQEFISKYRYWRGECADLEKKLETLKNKKPRPKLIKKTLSITPELNQQAEDLGINFSHILREALKKEIKQLKERK